MLQKGSESPQTEIPSRNILMQVENSCLFDDKETKTRKIKSLAILCKEAHNSKTYQCLQCRAKQNITDFRDCALSTE